jgi:hypothetical protein
MDEQHLVLAVAPAMEQDPGTAFPGGHRPAGSYGPSA